ncbi:O-antigen ligase family protein [Alteromonas sp. ASW11-130]|uniref:O-antigen ligase family protein n=1 Tax=Alteromonas sp. ASW11-130 TaxID=3015775 RepID=UPI002241FBC3|nr:O-antigen ligase family protein [Alteromonas sp. ASW11-130]MCW8090402.1 O-antigen ligase family protein [Alteromonas sp. ASW11-130]
MFALVKVVFALISAFLVYKTISKQCNKYLAFVVVALWLRFTLSAFHNVTYEPVFAGFSMNALASIGIAFAGLLLLPRKIIALRSLFWLYVFLASIVISGLLNMRVMGLINVLVKWGVFLAIAGALFMAIRRTGKDIALRNVLVAFFLPVSLQIMSVLLGEVKATEADGSASYIGGYNHEAAFSMIIASFTLVVGLTSPKAFRYRALFFVVGCVLVILANYRTSILAILPMAAMFAFTLFETKVAVKHKPVFYVLSLFSIALGFLTLSYTMQDRFGDIFIFLSSWHDLLKAPEYYSEAEKDIFSARVYIWSLYIHAYFLADPINQIFGMGPESWNGVFKKYAHNTYVSYLYEYGIVGVVTFLIAVGSFLLQTFKTNDRRYAWLLFSSLIGFLIMNLATMPLWNIEGLLLYALLIGVIISPVRNVTKVQAKNSREPSNLARN